jgi:hypothetical protein
MWSHGGDRGHLRRPAQAEEEPRPRSTKTAQAKAPLSSVTYPRGDTPKIFHFVSAGSAHFAEVVCGGDPRPLGLAGAGGG